MPSPLRRSPWWRPSQPVDSRSPRWRPAPPPREPAILARRSLAHRWRARSRRWSGFWWRGRLCLWPPTSGWGSRRVVLSADGEAALSGLFPSTSGGDGRDTASTRRTKVCGARSGRVEEMKVRFWGRGCPGATGRVRGGQGPDRDWGRRVEPMAEGSPLQPGNGVGKARHPASRAMESSGLHGGGAEGLPGKGVPRFRGFSEAELLLRRSARRVDGRRLGRQTQVLADPHELAWIGHESHDLAPFSAAGAAKQSSKRAGEDVKPEHSFE